MVRVRDGEGAEWEDVDTCGGCNFLYGFSRSPSIESLEPSAGQPCERHSSNQNT